MAGSRVKPPLKGEEPAYDGRRGSFPPPRTSAAALSAAVDSTKLIKGAFTLRRNQVGRTAPLERQLLFGREREEGKDSHSRQWRLSMAVFLNRNKRPLAAPIEVAELLSEKPPPSQYPHHYFTNSW